MKERFSPGAIWAVLVGIVVVVAPARAVSEGDYVLDDVKVDGTNIHTFVDKGEHVTAVLGDVGCSVGGRVLTGRDAVLWVTQHKVGKVVRHDIMVYVEGSVKLVEPDGTVLTDGVLLMTLRNEGRLSIRGAMSETPLTDFPLYQRAMAVRSGKTTPHLPKPPGDISKMKVVPHEQSKDSQEPTRDVTTAVAEQKTPPSGKKPEPPQHGTFRADSTTIREDPQRRICIARGNVYLSRGDPDSATFLELRSQLAVAFSEKRPAGQKDTSSPYSIESRGMKTSLPGPEGAEEIITGVYLEGDVVIARGERYLRGERAYYDLTTDRAYVPDVVFRTIHKQRDIPIYVRAKLFRSLSAREIWFRSPRVTSSDFYHPSYHVGASEAYLMDKTEYDATGMQISEQSWSMRMKHTTFNIRRFPVFYWPYLVGDLTHANTAIRKVEFGHHGRFGWGAETEWSLFRLLGLIEPQGFKGRFGLDWYERGVLAGVNIKYEKQLANRSYSGYWLMYGMLDDRQRDEFGDRRKEYAPEVRGRVLFRHKEILPRDWRVQLELSYYCDRYSLEQFFPGEVYAGKEQETLFYAKKQRDNWAFTTLLKYRLNRFQTQTESAPDLGFYWLGVPLFGNNLTLYSESHAGLKRYRPRKGSGVLDSRMFVRGDTRNELNVPLHLGPLNVTPYAIGRLTYWDDILPDGERCRTYGQVGAKANMHFWKVFDHPRSRLWDIDRLRHIVTPEATAFVSCPGNVTPQELFPIDPDIEQHLGELHGVSFGVHQRLQTKRGLPGKQHSVDWMRLGVVAGFYQGDMADQQPANGRFFFYRPEYSVARDHLNFDYSWNISDATTFLSDANLDLESGDFRRANAGFVVTRNPRLRYYAGMRWIRDLDSAVGALGVSYKISRKYSASFFQQYDFAFRDGKNLATSLSITRKLPRWFVTVGFAYDATYDDISAYISFFPQGVPELRLGGERFSLLGRSEMN